MNDSTDICNKLISIYLEWLRSEMSVERDGSICRFTVPFLDRNNDYLQISVTSNGTQNLLTDCGATLAELRSSGIDLDTPLRQRILKSISRGFGITLGEGGELKVEATSETLGAQAHFLLQGMMAVNGLSFLSKDQTRRIFAEDVESYFFAKQIKFERNVKFPGSGGVSQTVDLFFPPQGRRTKPLFCELLGSPNLKNAQAALFLLDEVQKSQLDADVVILSDDDERPPQERVEKIALGRGVPVVGWSKREAFSSDMVASHG